MGYATCGRSPGPAGLPHGNDGPRRGTVLDEEDFRIAERRVLLAAHHRPAVERTAPGCAVVSVRRRIARPPKSFTPVGRQSLTVTGNASGVIRGPAPSQSRSNPAEDWLSPGPAVQNAEPREQAAGLLLPHRLDQVFPQLRHRVGRMQHQPPPVQIEPSLRQVQQLRQRQLF